jgi:integrase
MLVILGVRKKELITSKWSDFDWEERLFHIERKVTKNKVAIAVPISTHLQPIIDEVSKLANGSIYLFPAFKKSKNGHMCLNTINTALKKLLDKASIESDLGRIQRFTIHDLRRTFRTMLSRIGISKDIAELCINHRQLNSDDLSNDERYDRYVKIDQRRHACDQVAEHIMELVENDIIQLKEKNNIIPFRTAA